MGLQPPEQLELQPARWEMEDHNRRPYPLCKPCFAIVYYGHIHCRTSWSLSFTFSTIPSLVTALMGTIPNMDNIIFEDPSRLPKASKRNLGSLTQPLPHRDELPSAFAVEGTRELLCSPADAVSRAGKLGSHVASDRQ